MDIQTSDLNRLFAQLIIFPSHEIEAMRAKCREASPKAIEKVVEILKGALQKQQEYLEHMAVEIPGFAEGFQDIFRTAVQEMQGNVAVIEQKRLTQIEEEFQGKPPLPS